MKLSPLVEGEETGSKEDIDRNSKSKEKFWSKNFERKFWSTNFDRKWKNVINWQQTIIVKTKNGVKKYLHLSLQKFILSNNVIVVTNNNAINFILFWTTLNLEYFEIIAESWGTFNVASCKLGKDREVVLLWHYVLRCKENSYFHMGIQRRLFVTEQDLKSVI